MIRVFIAACLILISDSSPAQVKKVKSVSIVVNNMEKSLSFYCNVLDFQKVSDDTYYGESWEKLYGVFGLHIRKVQLQLGDEIIELIDYLTTGGRSIPEDAMSNDLSFQHIAIVVSNMDSAYNRLKKHHVEHVSTFPQTLPQSIPQAAGIVAFYFHDPDKHNLELIYFPKDKGQEKWHHNRSRLFLGIDHTATGVSNSAASDKFYAGILGLSKKGESHNKGAEQAHLNNVPDADLQISGYRAVSGIGVEFLQYLQPGPGKTYPADSKSNDLWNWITTMQVDDAMLVYEQLRSKGLHQFISKAPVDIIERKTRRRAFIIRDPDGHAVEISSAY